MSFKFKYCYILYVCIFICSFSKYSNAQSAIIARPDSQRWEMSYSMGWMGGGREQISAFIVNKAPPPDLRNIMYALLGLTEKWDIVLLSLNPELDGLGPALLYIDDSEVQGMSNELIWSQLPDFGRVIGKMYLEGNSQCVYISRQERAIGGYPSVQGTYRCVVGSGVRMILVFEQIDLAGKGMITVIFKTDERIWAVRRKELNQILSSFRMTK